MPEHPAADQPTADQPTADQPTADQPTADQPTADQPTADQPTADQPTADQPTADQPTADQPTADQPTADQPTADQPTADQPTADHPSEAKPVNLSATGPPTTVLDPEPAAALAALAEALAGPEPSRRDAVAAVVARWPRCFVAWATLGDLARDDVEAYACYRVGYHRGLDRLRANGWRGTGYVPWSAPENHGFLRSLQGLARAAAAIGEHDEAERCATFLVQCDPAHPAGP